MPDILIRSVELELKRKLEESAQTHRRSLSEEAKSLIRKGLNEPKDDRKLGTLMSQLVPSEYRGDDLVFEIPGDASEPPDFE